MSSNLRPCIISSGLGGRSQVAFFYVNYLTTEFDIIAPISLSNSGLLTWLALAVGKRGLAPTFDRPMRIEPGSD